jgi:hypothetical protein
LAARRHNCLLMKRSSARRQATAAVLVALAVAIAGPNAAQAKRVEKVCRERASLRHAPAGVPIGYLYRGDRVIVALYARRHRWVYAISARGDGWLLARALCRR